MVASGQSTAAAADQRGRAMTRVGPVRMLVVLAAFYGLAVVLGFVLLVAATRLGLFGGIAILFYRGLADLIAITPVLMLVLALLLRLPWPAGLLAGRDAVAAALVAVALNLAAFVVGPVTVDRSVSVFMLSRLEQAQAPATAEELRGDFTTIYLREWDQIGRRLDEQIASGNVEQAPGGRYRLTAQGRSFMATARTMSRLFAGDPRFVGIGDGVRKEGPR